MIEDHYELIEECVLGTVVQASMMDTPEEVKRIMDIYLGAGMCPEWFANPHAQEVFANIVSDFRTKGRIDIYLYGDETEYALACGERDAQTANAGEYCVRLKNQFQHRTFKEGIEAILRKASPQQFADTLAKMEELRNALLQPTPNSLDDEDEYYYTLADIPEYKPESENPDILIKGRWLERGGAGIIISTAGTGKSIDGLQKAFCFTEGKPCGGLVPNRPLKILICQTEDSKTRLSIDRPDVTAELTEQYPDIDWRQTYNKIRFLKCSGHVGADFLNFLDERLSRMSPLEKPDVIILNPFMTFVGGQVTDGAFVTPFLRGGEINHVPTKGLQFLLEKHAVGALCYHHTPKPPLSKEEVDKWLKSPFPEYQGAGCADIVNWGRSFISMMKVPDKPGVICMTAGKNGAELGWDHLDGAYRRYMAWSKATSVTGRGSRHAWRELDDDELLSVTGEARDKLAEDALVIVKALKDEPQRREDLIKKGRCGLSERRFRAAWNVVKQKASDYGIASVEFKTGRTAHVIWGEREAAKARADEYVRNWERANSGDEVTECHEVTRGDRGANFGEVDEVTEGCLPKGRQPPKCHPVETSQGDIRLVTPSLDFEPELLTSRRLLTCGLAD